MTLTRSPDAPRSAPRGSTSDRFRRRPRQAASSAASLCRGTSGTHVRGEGLLERFARGSFLRSLADDLPHVRLMLEHGLDQVGVGNRPLGRFQRIEETGVGL